MNMFAKDTVPQTHDFENTTHFSMNEFTRRDPQLGKPDDTEDEPEFDEEDEDEDEDDFDDEDDDLDDAEGDGDVEFDEDDFEDDELEDDEDDFDDENDDDEEEEPDAVTDSLGGRRPAFLFSRRPSERLRHAGEGIRGMRKRLPYRIGAHRQVVRSSTFLFRGIPGGDHGQRQQQPEKRNQET